MDYSLWLYGSHARGDEDALSDRDLLLVGPRTALRHKAVRTTVGAPTSVSQYEWPEIEKMAESGSLFLVHVRREGVELNGTAAGCARFRALLDSLGEYEHAARDIRGFRTLLDDVERSLREGGSRPFELGVLGGMVRHASVLACYLTGQPVFGRLSSIRVAAERLAMGAAFVDVFSTAYAFHMWEQGRAGRPGCQLEERADEVLALADTFLARLETRAS